MNSSSNRDSLFRIKSTGLTLLSNLWFEKEGKLLLIKLKEVITSIGTSQSNLEINPEKRPNSVSVKKNMKVILTAARSVLESDFWTTLVTVTQFATFYKSWIKLFPSDLLVTILSFQARSCSCVWSILPSSFLNSMVSLTLLRWQTMDEVDSCRWAKFCKTWSNNSEFPRKTYLASANRFIRRNLSRWISFFHLLFTGKEILNPQSSFEDTIEPQDLIATSNQDINQSLQDSKLFGKQTEVVFHMFQLEKQMEGWKEEQHKLYSLFTKEGWQFQVFMENHHPSQCLSRKCL